MKIRYRNLIIIANLVLLLTFFTFLVIKNEQMLENSTLVLLELAPKDPRSLMQGDYMALNYKITNPWWFDWNIDDRMDSLSIENELSKTKNFNNVPEKGFFVLKLDTNNVGEALRMQADRAPLNEDEIILKYKSFGRFIGAESYFFEEGKSEKYENARYGGLKVDQHGNCILLGLFDENFMKIE